VHERRDCPQERRKSQSKIAAAIRGPRSDSGRPMLLSFHRKTWVDHAAREETMRRLLRNFALAILCTLQLTPAAAQDEARDYPNRAIRIVVPFPAGGPADLVARIIAQKMSEDWAQPVIVENRAGGNTIVGAQAVAKAAPDGYTLLMAIDSTLTMNQFLYKSLPYDPLNDFAPITTTTRTISVLAVRAADGAQSVKDLIVKAKAAPGKLNYGAGTIASQLMGYRFHKAAGIDIVYVPFKGTPETVNGLLTGSVDLIYGANVIVNPLIASGQVRALAKMDSRPAPAAANLPSLAQAAGLPDLEDMSIWLGLVAPKGTPRPIIGKLQQKVAQILADPAVRERSERTGAYPMTSTPEEFAVFLRQEADRWSKVLKETNIRFD
jgi:tripartite-type tricarboxylate transporter receptor subunit TctC